MSLRAALPCWYNIGISKAREPVELNEDRREST